MSNEQAAAANKLGRELMRFIDKFQPKFETWVKTEPTEDGRDMMHNALNLVAEELLRLRSELE
jgi:hypothetical protein